MGIPDLSRAAQGSLYLLDGYPVEPFDPQVLAEQILGGTHHDLVVFGIDILNVERFASSQAETPTLTDGVKGYPGVHAQNLPLPVHDRALGTT